MGWKDPNYRAEMPLLDHLEELRQRLFACAVAVGVGLLISGGLFLFTSFDVIDFLAGPVVAVLPPGAKLVTLTAGALFEIKMNAAFILALIIASPVIIYQMWGFLAPALYVNERRVVVPVVIGIVVLFIAGIALGFTLIVPKTLSFLIGITSKSVTPMLDVREYLGFVLYMSLGFGAAFELPMVLMGLTALGLVSPKFLAKYRRYAFVGGLIAGGFITPDPTAMFYIGIPLYALYELSILLSRLVYRWRERRDAGDDVGEAPRGGPPSDDDHGPRRLGAPA